MGQYYAPINLDKKKWIYSHDIKSKYTRLDGASYIVGEGLKLMEHSYINNKLMNAVENLLIEGNAWAGDRIVWAGDYADPEPNTKENLYTIIGIDENKLNKPKTTKIPAKYRYILNLSKSIYVDKQKVKKDQDGFKIHPLSLLTCEGNSRGGGDFRGKNKTVGSWSRDRIMISDNIPEGFTEIIPNYIEN